MLIKLQLQDFEKYVDFAYKLSLDKTKCCFPAYFDGVKTKQDFIDAALKTFDSKADEILLFEYEKEVCGWIHYYVLKDDGYIGIHVFSIEKNARAALREFEEFCRENFAGMTLYAGFPLENREAVGYLKENGYELLETSYPFVFHFDNFEPTDTDKRIKSIKNNNFDEFEKLHSAVDGDMYWNCERIFSTLENWAVYLFDDGKNKAALYCNVMGDLPEIFGVDFESGAFDEDAFKALIRACLNDINASGKRHLYYFAEQNETRILSELSFVNIGAYNCYIKTM